jgi:hypothetical protein
MKRPSPLIRFLRFEVKLLLLALLLILFAGFLTWNSFFKTVPLSTIQRDYLVDDVAQRVGVRTERLANFDHLDLEIVERLDLNGLIALEQQPEPTRRVFTELKNFQLFYDVVQNFGPAHVIPVLDFYYDEGNLALLLEAEISHLVKQLFESSAPTDTLSDRQKRLLAILSEIDTQEHGFLSRFIFTQAGARRNYVTSTTSTLTHFFTGGLARLNAAMVTRGVQQVTTAELVDAGIDLLVLIPFAAYLTRTSKVALQGGRAAAIAEKSAVRGGTATVVQSGRTARLAQASGSVLRTIPVRTLFKMRYVKWYILGLAVIKPDLINHAASLVADAFSVPPILMKSGFWFLLLFPVLNLIFPFFLLLRAIYRGLFRPRRTAVRV